jgi:hypothetical protein
MKQSLTKPGEMERQRLTSRLSCLRLSAFDVKRDGNCQFRAISHQLYGDENYHQIVRGAAISYN